MFATPINDQAPVIQKQSTVINAPIEAVWKTLTTIEQWPTWQKDVTETRISSEPTAGTIFTWKAGGLSFTSRIHTCNKPFLFGWTGKTIGAYAVHNWKFSQTPAGTLVEVEESLEGFFPKIFRKKFSKNLLDGMRKNLNELKEFTEKTT